MEQCKAADLGTRDWSRGWGFKQNAMTLGGPSFGFQSGVFGSCLIDGLLVFGEKVSLSSPD